MNIKEISALVTGAIVSIIIVSAVLVPILSVSATEYDVYDNRQYAMYEMTHIDENTDYELIWRVANPTVVEVNGSNADLSSGTIICAVDDWIYRFGKSGNGYFVQLVGSVESSSLSESAGTNGVFTISISNGVGTVSITGIDSPTEIAINVTDGFGICADGEGDYVMKSPTQNAYVLDSSRIVGMGITTVDGAWNIGFCADGTVENLDITQYAGTVQYTIGNETITSADVTGIDGLKTITKYEFDVTNPTTSNETHITYSYFIVPAEVTADNPEYVGGVMSTLLGILPVMAVLSILVGIGSWAYLRRT